MRKPFLGKKGGASFSEFLACSLCHEGDWRGEVERAENVFANRCQKLGGFPSWVSEGLLCPTRGS